MHAVVWHAEVYAIMFRNCLDLEGCTLYTTLFPCLECAKTIIRSGIRTIYYLTDIIDHKHLATTASLQQVPEPRRSRLPQLLHEHLGFVS